MTSLLFYQFMHSLKIKLLTFVLPLCSKLLLMIFDSQQLEGLNYGSEYEVGLF